MRAAMGLYLRVMSNITTNASTVCDLVHRSRIARVCRCTGDYLWTVQLLVALESGIVNERGLRFGGVWETLLKHGKRVEWMEFAAETVSERLPSLRVRPIKLYCRVEQGLRTCMFVGEPERVMGIHVTARGMDVEGGGGATLAGQFDVVHNLGVVLTGSDVSFGVLVVEMS